jgi:hypothetical protein
VPCHAHGRLSLCVTSLGCAPGEARITQNCDRPLRNNVGELKHDNTRQLQTFSKGTSQRHTRGPIVLSARTSHMSTFGLEHARARSINTASGFKWLQTSRNRDRWRRARAMPFAASSSAAASSYALHTVFLPRRRARAPRSASAAAPTARAAQRRGGALGQPLRPLVGRQRASTAPSLRTLSDVLRTVLRRPELFQPRT